MLKLKYSLNTSSYENEIFLGDMYVSPDLSFISGTTQSTSFCDAGQNVKVRSTYFPQDMLVKVVSRERVKRNGYILVPITLPINSATVINDESEAGFDTIYFVEHGGNTIYSVVGSDPITFIIDDVEYSATNVSTLEIEEKVYVENDKIVVNGITYNAIINNNSELFVTDSVGEPYLFDDLWYTSGVTSASTFVEKLVIGSDLIRTIDYSSVKSYGHYAYIIYNDEKYYFQYLPSSGASGCGVTIGDEDYYLKYCNGEHVGDNVDLSFNIYNILDYEKISCNKPYIDINGHKCQIYFEPSEIRDTGIICIETVETNPSILVGDKITIKSTEGSSEVIVKHDNNNRDYVYFNGKRYDVIENLCDSINIGGYDYMLTTESAGTGTKIASITTNDGSKMYFEISGNVASKVEYIDGQWSDVYTVQYSGSSDVVVYSANTQIEVDEHNGVQFGQYRAVVRHKEIIFKDSGGTEQIDYSYDYVVANNPLEHRFVVINTVGNNRILCVPDIDKDIYGESATTEMMYDALDSIKGKDFIIQKMDNAFGVDDLYPQTWLGRAYRESGGTSVYELSNVTDNVRILQQASYYSFPITFSNDQTNKLLYEDLVINKYYPGEEDKAVNKIVDMEKDVYEPGFINKGGGSMIPLQEIEFNLHFRTRDLETWKILEDEGVYRSSGTSTMELGANYQYCNYFITDYYPYYNYVWKENSQTGQQEFNAERFYELTKNSDLLGFLWFTTDDVKYKKDKLSKSFLRLTFFDSKNPEKQNMLGTSTLYFGCGRYFDVLDKQYIKTGTEEYHYEPTAQSRQLDRSGEMSGADNITPSTDSEPNVITECFKIKEVSGVALTTVDDLVVGDSNLKLDTRIILGDRYRNFNSSEGFYAYILKEFADKNVKKTIYMKAEFFHAGVGIKIPLVIPTKYTESGYTAISKEDWDESTYNEFISGYDLKSVFDRIYIPITIGYSKTEKKFVYSISEDNNYINAISDNKVDYPMESGRYETDGGTTQGVNCQRITEFVHAPLYIKSSSEGYTFAVITYDLEGNLVSGSANWSSNQTGKTECFLENENYMYRVYFQRGGRIPEEGETLSSDGVKDNYIIGTKKWSFNLFELKIKS